jgi:hypothetical protein
MLQKIYWLAHIQDDAIHTTQEFRTFFCKHKFPHLTLSTPAFVMIGGGSISNTHAWTIAINNQSIITGAGSSYTSADKVSEQIRRLMILRMNLFFGKSPGEVESHCDMSNSSFASLIPRKILPEVFGDSTKNLYEEVSSLAPWLYPFTGFTQRD